MAHSCCRFACRLVRIFSASGCKNRRRENAEQIEQRLARAAEYQEKLPAGCRRLDNDGNLDDTLAALLALLPSLAKQPQDAVP